MKVLKGILIGIVSIAVAVFLCYFIFHLDTVKVDGTEYYTDEEIRNAVFVRDFSDNEIMFFIYDKLFGINTLPFVEEIEAEYHNPRSMTLHVYDKKISGCINYLGQYVYFDKDGIVLQTIPEQIEGIPVVTGINFGNFTVGQPFQVADDSVFDSIMNVSQQISHYSIPVDEIKVSDGAIRLVIASLKVDLGKKKRYDDALADLAGVIEKAQEENIKLKGTINMENYQSGDRIVVKPSEKKKSKSKKAQASASPDPDSGKAGEDGQTSAQN
ncbi:MAG: hypothetical protein K2K70_13825, partial [Lachnospiraceae bacterium]|nr:hypothetical protein [Lachnospiraceae bacterium]